MPASPLYRFGPFLLDPRERLLTRAGEPVPLTPKVFDTLLVLVRSGGRVVDKETIIGAVWPNAFVEESNLTQNVFVLRKTLGATKRVGSTSGLSRGAATSSRPRSSRRATCCPGRGV